jgi:hypothetical protein
MPVVYLSHGRHRWRMILSGLVGRDLLAGPSGPALAWDRPENFLAEVKHLWGVC